MDTPDKLDSQEAIKKSYKLLSGMYSFRPNWEFDDHTWVHQAARVLRKQLELDDHGAWELCKEAQGDACGYESSFPFIEPQK